MDLSTLDELAKSTTLSEADLKSTGLIDKGTYNAVISGAVVQEHEKFGANVNLEATLETGRKVWSTYWLTGDYSEGNMKRLKEQVVRAGVDVFTSGEDLARALEEMKGRSVEIFVGIKKNGKNYFAINSETTEPVDTGFDADEDIPF